MDKERREYIRARLAKADNDLKSAKIVFDSHEPDVPYDTVCFHCQQAVEKYLKALLVYYDIVFPKTHNIAQLVLLYTSA